MIYIDKISKSINLMENLHCFQVPMTHELCHRLGINKKIVLDSNVKKGH